MRFTEPSAQRTRPVGLPASSKIWVGASQPRRDGPGSVVPGVVVVVVLSVCLSPLVRQPGQGQHDGEADGAEVWRGHLSSRAATRHGELTGGTVDGPACFAKGPLCPYRPRSSAQRAFVTTHSSASSPSWWAQVTRSTTTAPVFSFTRREPGLFTAVRTSKRSTPHSKNTKS